MTIQEAIKRAIETEYQKHFFKNCKISRVEIDYGENVFVHFWDDKANQSDMITLHLGETLLDPQFWACLFGEKNGRIKAKELIDYLFDGKTSEQFFGKEMPGMSKTSKKTGE